MCNTVIDLFRFRFPLLLMFTYSWKGRIRGITQTSTLTCLHNMLYTGMISDFCLEFLDQHRNYWTVCTLLHHTHTHTHTVQAGIPLIELYAEWVMGTRETAIALHDHTKWTEPERNIHTHRFSDVCLVIRTDYQTWAAFKWRIMIFALLHMLS